MHALVQGLILGVLTSGVYALMASGQTLIFGVMKLINLAQGALVLVGAYLSHQLFTSWGLDPFLSIPITTLVLFVVGALIEICFLAPLREQDKIELSLLVTFAIALLLEGLMTLVWSNSYRSIQTSYVDMGWTVGGYRISMVRLCAFLLSLAMLGLLYLLLTKTGLGRAIRATVQNPESARLLGVQSRAVSAIGFGLGSATAAAAGAVYGLMYPFYPTSHYDLIAVLLSIVVLGGMGSIGGAVIGALVVSVTVSVVGSVWTPTWAPMAYFAILIGVLLTRPQGLFGATSRGAL